MRGQRVIVRRKSYVLLEIKRMIIAALAAVVLMADAAPAAQPVAPAADKPKLICKKVTPIGSRMPTKVCQTPEQIAQERADAKQLTQDMQKVNPEPVR